MKVKNYTSWNIKTKPMTLVTYTNRCRKLHLKLWTLPKCSNGWNWGVAHCTKVWGPCYFSPLSGLGSLVPLELACKVDTLPVTADVTWNISQMKCLYIKWICSETYQIKCLCIKQICGETYQMKCLYIKQIYSETYQIKFVYMKQIYSKTYQIKFLYMKQIYSETYQIKFFNPHQ